MAVRIVFADMDDTFLHTDKTLVDENMAFTEDVYAPALLRGDRLSAAREREVADQLSEFWGLTAEHILEHHLRIDLTDFRQNILKDEGKICGRLDMRSLTASFERWAVNWVLRSASLVPCASITSVAPGVRWSSQAMAESPS